MKNVGERVMVVVGWWTCSRLHVTLNCFLKVTGSPPPRLQALTNPSASAGLKFIEYVDGNDRLLPAPRFFVGKESLLFRSTIHPNNYPCQNFHFQFPPSKSLSLSQTTTPPYYQSRRRLLYAYNHKRRRGIIAQSSNMADSAVNPLASLSEIAASLPRQPISSSSPIPAPTSIKPAPIAIKQRRLSSAGQSRRRHSDATAATLTNVVVSRVSYVSNLHHLSWQNLKA